MEASSPFHLNLVDKKLPTQSNWMTQGEQIQIVSGSGCSDKDTPLILKLKFG